MRIIDVSEGLFGKPYLTFDDGTQLSLSAFNCRVLARAYGMESDNWLGKTLRLGVNEFQYQDKLQDIILVTPLSPPIENKVPPKPKFDEAPF